LARRGCGSTKKSKKQGRITALAEREVIAIIGRGCHAPIGAYAQLQGKAMTLFGFVSDLEGDCFIKRSIQGTAENRQWLAWQLADQPLAAGGRSILEE
jgi:hydroxymethylbilane synthase